MKSKIIVSSIAMLLIIIIFLSMIFAPPTIDTSSLNYNQTVRVDGNKYTIEGKIYPYGALLTINDKPVDADSRGKFITDVQLSEGDNTVTIKAVDGKKITEKTYKVHRLTSQELAEKEKQKLENAKQLDNQTVSPTNTGDTSPKTQSSVINPEDYWHKVTKVVDGDTVKALVDGQEQTIRIIGINTPESTIEHECYGEESSAKAKEFLTGKWIQLKADNTQDNKDKYGRLLRYVYFDSGTDFGKRMIEEGYAYEYTYDKPYQHRSDYITTQAYSKGRSFGLWSVNTCNGLLVKPQATSNSSSTSATTTTPAPAASNQTNSSAYYANCTAARNAGVAPIYSGQPGYRSALDRDGDGVACE